VPLEIRENISLRSFNTFGVEAVARYFTEIHFPNEWQELYQSGWLQKEHLVLGGGSNILFTGDYPGLVILNRMRGIAVVAEDGDAVWLKSAAGESWHGLVMYAVANGWGGIENLSLIPGLVGAAPMQNIGAYGVELRDVFVSLEAMEVETGELRVFDREACRFGYRQSFFKEKGKGKYIILSVTLRLSKQPVFHTEYGTIRETIDKLGVQDLSVKAVSDAVIAIRQSKLPDPAVLGNAGSFFKNPTITAGQASALLSQYPAMPHFAAANGYVKIPAAWLIEQCGWKGKRIGNTGCHAQQALVIVNYGGATGEEIWAHAKNVQGSVLQQFGILLEPEVNRSVS
jgi:UDP-N-acetylmuramate dehydrogenase